jgi:hypothetical protein
MRRMAQAPATSRRLRPATRRSETTAPGATPAKAPPRADASQAILSASRHGTRRAVEEARAGLGDAAFVRSLRGTRGHVTSHPRPAKRPA